MPSTITPSRLGPGDLFSGIPFDTPVDVHLAITVTPSGGTDGKPRLLEGLLAQDTSVQMAHDLLCALHEYVGSGEWDGPRQNQRADYAVSFLSSINHKLQQLLDGSTPEEA